jgi:hypothetical protein
LHIVCKISDAFSDDLNLADSINLLSVRVFDHNVPRALFRHAILLICINIQHAAEKKKHESQRGQSLGDAVVKSADHERCGGMKKVT